jgi:hypothetical protein
VPVGTNDLCAGRALARPGSACSKQCNSARCTDQLTKRAGAKGAHKRPATSLLYVRGTNALSLH